MSIEPQQHHDTNKPAPHDSSTGNIATLLLESVEPVADFNPGPDELCYCGTNKRFWHCCGSAEIQRPPPFGLFMFENYLDLGTVKELREFADQSVGERLKVIQQDKSSTNSFTVEDDRRIAERIDITAKREQINALVQTIFVDLAKSCFQRSLHWLEIPELMRYREGGFYIRHADSQNLDPEKKCWTKVADRDLSILIYLNDDFEGGELSFYNLNYQVRPRAGAVVIFPSDHRFLHQAEIVKKGLRYAIVSWAAVKGIPKLLDTPPNYSIVLP